MAEAVTYQDLIRAFTTFLTVCIHTIIYERNIYPATTFISARKYNYAVRQSRHPRVCEWIQDAVAGVESELLACSLERVAVVIYSPQDQPLERFMFDVSRFPVVPQAEQQTSLERTDEKEEKVAVLPKVDLEEQFRAAMSRLSGCGARLRTLPEDCTFTVAVELKDQSEPPMRRGQVWIPAQPSLQKTVTKGDGGVTVEKGQDVGGVKTIPVRAIAAGGMAFEMWIEEGRNEADGARESHGDSSGPG